MKRLVALAILIVAAATPVAGAASLPSPTSLLDRHRSNNRSHYVRQDARPKLPSPADLNNGSQPRRFRPSHLVRGR